MYFVVCLYFFFSKAYIKVKSKKKKINCSIFTCGRQHTAHCTLHITHCTLHTTLCTWTWTCPFTWTCTFHSTNWTLHTAQHMFVLLFAHLSLHTANTQNLPECRSIFTWQNEPQSIHLKNNMCQCLDVYVSWCPDACHCRWYYYFFFFVCDDPCNTKV